MTRPPKPDDDEAALFDLPLHRPAGPVPRRALAPRPADSGEEPFGSVVEAAPPIDAARSGRGDTQPTVAPKIPATRPALATPAAPAAPAARPEAPSIPDPAVTGGGESEPDRDEAAQISFAMTLPFEEKTEATAEDLVTAAVADAQPVRAGFGTRLVAGLIDLTIIAGSLAVAATGASLMGVPPRIADWPAFLILGLIFSFLYYVIPLAFWGRSGGMAVRRLFVRSQDGRPLSFSQAAQRWLAALLTLATLGLPTLLALTPRSLADRLSKSRTFTRP